MIKDKLTQIWVKESAKRKLKSEAAQLGTSISELTDRLVSDMDVKEQKNVKKIRPFP